ncbi:general odorant-binding protein 57b-like [Drosophila ficusphila]|uniref:general odorant-binding protein 57b-like n=1 Tax=Drosophila ficusphila TaxID=30025 RepID=UPI0007E5D075|nr:general odorant-binding protein 57b-like [Drosophila ficusphila]
MNRLDFFALLILAIISHSKADGHPFDFFNETLDDFEDCLQKTNVSIEEYEKFEEFGNLKNLLNEDVELKYKCNVKCQLERQPTKWLNDQGKMDLKLMNATDEAEESIIKCMAQASEEPCAYAFKLVICAYEAGHPVIEYEYYDYEEVEEETTEEYEEQVTEEAEEQPAQVTEEQTAEESEDKTAQH